MKPPKSLLRKLLYSAPILAVIACFQNFDENSIVQQMDGIKVEEKTHILHSTTLSGAAEEIFVNQYAPEARMFTEKMGEKVRFGFSQRQYDGTQDFDHRQVEAEVRMQVIGSSDGRGTSMNIVNADRIRLTIEQANLTCDYNPFQQSVQVRRPLSNRSNLQIEHQSRTNQGRLSWQMSW